MAYIFSDTANKESLYVTILISELISYSIGCQMGRYSLDREGLVYAHEGNKGFSELVAEGAYKTFPADSDGILPLMDDEPLASKSLSAPSGAKSTCRKTSNLSPKVYVYTRSSRKKANLRLRPFVAIFPPSSGKII